eukprot:5658623-Prymnesium_polylepis.2
MSWPSPWLSEGELNLTFVGRYIDAREKLAREKLAREKLAREMLARAMPFRLRPCIWFHPMEDSERRWLAPSRAVCSACCVFVASSSWILPSVSLVHRLMVLFRSRSRNSDSARLLCIRASISSRCCGSSSADGVDAPQPMACGSRSLEDAETPQGQTCASGPLTAGPPCKS